LHTDSSITDDEFVEMVATNPYVVAIRYDSFGVCLVWAEYSNTAELSELGAFFRSLKGVESVEMHTLPADRGNKIKLTRLQMRVLEPLLDDPHMPIAEVAKRTGLSAKRVRKIIGELIQGRGILFTIIYDIPAGDVLHLVFRIRYNPQVIDSISLVKKIQSDFQMEYYREFESAMEPVIWLEFLIEQLTDSEAIATRIREIPSVDLVSTIIPYPLKFSRLRRKERLLEEITIKLHST
jgi:DNA-binding Lrp family transcriptional regulator